MTMRPESLQSLRAQAAAGDARAQYALSAEMSVRGALDEARYWLEKAAAQDFPDALCTLSAAKITGASGEPVNAAEGVAGLQRAGDLGSRHAMRTLAALYGLGAGVARGWRPALAALRRACEGDDPVSLRQTAMLLFLSDPDDADGAAMIEAAAPYDGVAAGLAVRRACLGRAGSDMETARRALAALAQVGYPLSSALAAALETAHPAPIGAGGYSLEAAFARLENNQQSDIPARDVISVRPNIAMARGAFLPEACDYMIAAAAPRLQRGEIVLDDKSARVHQHRTAWASSFHAGSSDLPLVVMTDRLAGIVGLPLEQAEPLSVLRYRRDEEYRAHHDFLGPDEEDLKRRGQRMRTGLIYLNDGYEGGETHFLAPDIKVAGGVGDVLVFDNIDEKGAPDISARHAGLAVRAGEKWLASVWFRDRPYTP